jgi:hypothetical protein
MRWAGYVACMREKEKSIHFGGEHFKKETILKI